jgi:type IV secretory pathway VirB10-like protein
MKNRQRSHRLLAVLLGLSLCLGPESAVAWQQPESAQQPQVVDPNIPPAVEEQSPEEQALPDAPSSTSNERPQQPTVVPIDAAGNEADLQQLESSQQERAETQAGPSPQRSEQPLGTAAAEKARTAGGAASRPAGVAIAPAKQKRSRSFLIKLGAIAAGAAAVGTIYALSRGTPSLPPGASQTPR